MLKKVTTVVMMLVLLTLSAAPLVLAQPVGVVQDNDTSGPGEGTTILCVECDRPYPGEIPSGNPSGSGVGTTNAGFLQYSPASTPSSVEELCSQFGGPGGPQAPCL